MSKENKIRRGMLSEKMGNFHAEPPADAWDHISSRLHPGGSRKVLLIMLAAAAGLALAITVGIKLIDVTPETPIAEIQVQDQAPAVVPAVEEKENGQAQSEIQPSRIEEKVIVAMDEVIRQMVDEEVNNDQQEQVILAENIKDTQDIVADDQEDRDTSDHEVQTTDDQENEVTYDQDVIDQEASQRYLDSISNALIAEDEIIPSDEKEKKKWQLGASLTPLFSYRDASSPDQAQNMAADDSESGLMAYSGGVQIRYAQSNRLSFESGLYYNKMGLAIGDFNTYRSNMDFVYGNETFTDNSIVSMSNSIGTISTASTDVVVNAWAGPVSERYNTLDSKEMKLQDEVVNSFVQSLGYLEIPFNIKYKIVDRDLKVSLIGGISTNLLVGNQVIANTSNGKFDYGSVQDIRTLNYSGNAGVGFVYEFPGNFSLSFEPRFRYYLNSINTESLPVTRPYALGVYTGVNYTF